jgi:hypothetical protein
MPDFKEKRESRPVRYRTKFIETFREMSRMYDHARKIRRSMARDKTRRILREETGKLI